MEERNRIKGEFTVCRSGSPARREAVSYTHLDVYKRQGENEM